MTTIPEPTILRARPHSCALRLPVTVLLVALSCFAAIFTYDKKVFDNNGRSGLDDSDEDILLEVDDDVVLFNEDEVPMLHQHGQSISFKSSKTGHIIHSTYTKDATSSVLHPKAKAPTPKIGNKIIYFLHIPHGGGSSLCQLARDNKMTANYKNNCNAQTDLHCCGGADSVKAQQDYYQKTMYSYVSADTYMYNAMDPQHYFYVVLLRQSRPRYMSHHTQLLADAKTSDLWIDWWQHQPDNINTRMLCGADCVGSHKYQITRQQWDKTLARLKQFGAFLFFEQLDHSYQQFAEEVGWKPRALRHQKNATTMVTGPTKWEPMMTTLDDALYKYAFILSLGGNDAQLSEGTGASVNYYFAKGASKGCTNPCCGPCSAS